jgi:hypothetical protein
MQYKINIVLQILDDIVTIFRNSTENMVFYTTKINEPTIYSYIKLDKDDVIVDIAEKNKISDSFFLGLGRWTRANPEICVLATKGSIKRLSKSVRQLQVFPIGSHSQKPEQFKNLIIELEK